MKISIIGLGYIGLPTAAMFAEAGFEVSGYDADPEVRCALRNGCSATADADVRAIAVEGLKSGKLRVDDVLQPADAYIICVPTPTRERKPDLRHVEETAEAIASLLKNDDLVILESTVPPGTTERVIGGAVRRAGRDPDTVHIVHAPERVIPGDIIRELRSNARVIGGRKSGDAAAAGRVYASFVSGEVQLTDCLTAELVKVVENTYRDINIAYANELALLAEELDVDAWEAIRLANAHPRVNILSPGPGVGGHCIPVDPHFLSNANPFVTELIQTARRINERMPHIVVRRIERLTAPRTKIALLGASYKANVDDTRETPTRAICALLEERGYSVAVSDPIATRFSAPLYTLNQAVEDASALVLLTDHDEFGALTPADVGKRMRARVLIDTRNFFSVDRWQSAGFECYTLGRGYGKEIADISAA